MAFLPYAVISLIAGVAAYLVAAPILLRPSRAERRILEVSRSARIGVRRIGIRERVIDAAIAAARLLRSRVGLSDTEKLRQRFIGAGLRPGQLIEVYFASRLAGPLAGIVLGTFFPSNTVLACIAGAFIGYAVPDFWLARMEKRRKDRIRRGIPDAIDLMVICVDAGLGIDQALLKVGHELSINQPALSREFLRVNLEQRAGKPRVEAWRSMAERTQIPEFISLVNMLVQTDRFGTPIIRALSRFAAEIRSNRRQKAEEAAAKTKVKILFPLVLFIFPTIFIVLLGPPLLNILRTFALFK